MLKSHALKFVGKLNYRENRLFVKNYFGTGFLKAEPNKYMRLCIVTTENVSPPGRPH